MDLKIGNSVRYLGGDPNNSNEALTKGKTYEIEGFSRDDKPYFINNNGDEWYICETQNNEKCYKKIVFLGDSEEEDNVNSPKHYTRGKFETIDVIEHITQGYENPFVGHCVGTTVKYLDRAPYKHDSPVECLKKAVWYLEKAIETVEKESK